MGTASFGGREIRPPLVKHGFKEIIGGYWNFTQLLGKLKGMGKRLGA